MKKRLVLGLTLFALVAVSFINPLNTLVGRWQQRFPNGTVFLIDFRPSGSYMASVNGKYFVGGKYTVKQDTIAFADGVCNLNYQGTYRLNYLTPDSVQFAVIQDTCGVRRRGTDKEAFSRVKSDPAR